MPCNVDLKPYEFVISLDNDAEAVFKEGKSVNLQIKNPHPAGEYDVSALSLIKVLVNKMKDLKPRKPMPSDLEIRQAVHALKLEAMKVGDTGAVRADYDVSVEIYKKAWRDSQ